MRSLLLLALLAGCFGKRPGNGDLVYQLDREVIALKQKLDWLEQRQGDCGDGGQPAAIYAELVQIIPETEARVERQGSITLVTIQVSRLFASGSLRLRRESTMVLDLVSTALNLHGDAPVQIVGYTDDTPVGGSMRRYYATNWELSAVRAAAVGRELIDAYMVDPARITVSGRGPMEPVADNDTPEGRDANRRIVIRILPPVVTAKEAP